LKISKEKKDFKAIVYPNVELEPPKDDVVEYALEE